MTRREKLIASLMVAAGFGAAGLAFLLAAPSAPAAPLKSAAVLVATQTGHGSGVYIGDDLVLTAAHVVEGDGDFLVGGKKADVLWAAKAYDVALLQIAMPGAAPAPLACRAPRMGEDVHAIGNPGPLRDIHSYGKVAGADVARGLWKSSVIVNFAIAPGMSGGPVYDAAGAVLGLVVGVAAIPSGFSASFISFGYVVPSTAICKLLARGT